ncbi:MAG: BBP7 family outer membrane beta-barrel protein [Planctomycetales bacterium]|nr:BBP7 family outer membrane beta-barrel protein [Planctomycetales bacterium]
MRKFFRATSWLLTAALAATSPLAAIGQSSGGYTQPTFHGGAVPAYPASPLAGGMSAAQGGAFMDAHGNPVVMPASYCQSCQGGEAYGAMGGCYDGGCYDGGGGYGDAGYAQFGGYGMEQCGPHYFDLSVDAVFLTEERLTANAAPFASVGVGANAPRVLDPSSAGGDYEAGWQIAGRYDIGALAVFEGTYMGIYDIGFNQTVNSVDVTNPVQDFQLFSAFSNYGVPTPLAGIDDGQSYSLGYDAQLQSAELSYRRYWVGHRPRFSGTWLVGFRYLKLDENLVFNAASLVTPSGGGSAFVANSSRRWDSKNDLVGFQLGGDGWMCLRQGLRLGAEGKAGLYNNSYKFRHAGTFPTGVTGVPPTDFDLNVRNDQVAFASEGQVSLVADILPSLSLKASYRVLYLNSLASVSDSVDVTDIASTAIANQGDALFHGFTGGIEYVW